MATIQTPVRATQVPDGQSLESFEDTPGAYQLEASGKGLFYYCPCGCGEMGYLGFKGKASNDHPTWAFNGNVAAPTLQPSIRRTFGCKFHGYLTEGLWKFEADSGR